MQHQTNQTVGNRFESIEVKGSSNDDPQIKTRHGRFINTILRDEKGPQLVSPFRSDESSINRESGQQPLLLKDSSDVIFKMPKNLFSDSQNNWQANPVSKSITMLEEDLLD